MCVVGLALIAGAGCAEDARRADATQDVGADVEVAETDVGDTRAEADAVEVEVEVEVDEEPSYTALVDAELWRLVPDERDPFFAARPEGMVCAPEGLFTEAGTLEINTGLCDWPTLEQPLLASVAADDALEIIFFFGPVLAPEPAEAVLELRFGDDVIWAKTFALPTTGGFIPHVVTATRGYTAGEMATFHLHNHGANTWNLASISIVGSGSE